MSQSFTLRLPDDVVLWIENKASERKINKSQFVLSILQDNMQDKSKTVALQLQDTAFLLETNEIADSFPVQDKRKTVVLQLQDSFVALTAAVEAATEQQRVLTTELAAFSVVRSSQEMKGDGERTSGPPEPEVQEPNPQSKAKSKTTKRGGAPAPIYRYKGQDGTLTEHLVEAFHSQLTTAQINQARNNINRRIKGRKGRSSGKQWEPGEAIKREIELWEEKLG